jgi:hypothetical protein
MTRFSRPREVISEVRVAISKPSLSRSVSVHNPQHGEVLFIARLGHISFASHADNVQPLANASDESSPTTTTHRSEDRQ